MTSSTDAHDNQSERIQRSASFVVKAPVEKAFPLFGPIREKDWAYGWDPKIIFSTHPEVEERMIFKTAGAYEGESEYFWVLTQFRPNDFLVEYTVSTSNRVWFITVKCEPHDNYTNVTVTYSYTGLTEYGNQLNKIALDKMFAHNLNDWEEAINYYLATGKQKQG